MDNFMTTFIMFVLTAALGFTLYLLFKKKPQHEVQPIKKTKAKTSAVQDEDYTLFYNNESEGATYGDIALNVRIRNINSNSCTDSIIYYDSNLQSNFVSIGRASSNNYYLHSRYIDNEESLYLRKKGAEFQLRGNSNSKNGIAYTYHGDRVTKKITFTDSVKFYIGPVEFIFTVPGCYPSTNSRVISGDDIFNDDDFSEVDESKTKTYN